jgi:FixJ family two-component response regulator
VAIDVIRRKKPTVSLEDAMVGGRIGSSEMGHEVRPATDPRVRLLKELLKGLSETDRQIAMTLASSGPGDCWTRDWVAELGLNANTLRVRRKRVIERLKRKIIEQQDKTKGGMS